MSNKPITKPEWGSKEYLKMSDGASLLVRTTGPNDAPTILCLSRFGGNGLEFARFAECYSDRFKIISLDRRGHGGSDYLPQEQGYSIQQFASDLFEVIDQLKVSDAIGIGVSLGGQMLGLLHEKYPKILRAAILVDIGPEAPEPEDMEKAMAHMMLTREQLGATYETFAETITAWRNVQGHQWPNVADAEWEILAAATTEQNEDGHWYFTADTDGFMNRQPASPPPDYWPSWKALSHNVPTMLVYGELSNLLSAEIIERMISGTDVQLVSVPGIGHWPLIDSNPVRDAIKQFILQHQK